MFHILVARFLLEANENIPKKCDLNDVSLHFGQDCVAHLQLGDVFDRPDVTLVPALDANAGSNGVMKRTAFEYIESTILQTVREHRLMSLQDAENGERLQCCEGEGWAGPVYPEERRRSHHCQWRHACRT